MTSPLPQQPATPSPARQLAAPSHARQPAAPSHARQPAAPSHARPPAAPSPARPPATATPAQPANLPPGYPAEYQQLLRLRDGHRVLVRPIVPGDAQALAEAIRDADADTLRRRFLGGAPAVTPALLAHLTTVDYVRRFALVAIDPASQRGIAIGRYESAGPGTADIAVVVSPAWRGLGLATSLVGLLAKAADERGIRTFSGSYLAGNRPVAALIEGAGKAAKLRIDQGIAEFSVSLRS